MHANYYKLTYELNEKIYPKIGEIFCFDTLENAKIFAGDDFFSILECKGKKSKYQRRYINGGVYGIREFWEKDSQYDVHLKSRPPNGTVFMDWIIPLEEVKKETEETKCEL